MDLTQDQERKIDAIIAEMDCPKDFKCYESKFEDLTPVKASPGNKIIECLRTDQSYCPMSFVFGFRQVFCKCPLRRYVAFELGR